ncbi:MAG: PKD domain-containing protein, partial [Bacteroidota bacterium]
LSLQGGKGGDVTNASDRCFGPGGGGAGGRILVAAADVSNWRPNIELQQGGPGLRLNSNECGPTDEPAGGGNIGNEQRILFPVPFAGFVQTQDTFCGGEQLLLTDNSRGTTGASWEVEPASEALTISQLGLSLRINFANNASGTFRAIQTLRVGTETYPGDTATFTVYPVAEAERGNIAFDDELVTASVSGASGFDAIRYDFGDGTVIDTTVSSLQHTYEAGGDYIVSITLLNSNCGDVTVTTSRETVGEFARAEISEKDAEGCAPLAVTVADASTGTYADRIWNFPGGTPETSNEVGPTVTYDTPGEYFITLTLLDAIGSDTFRRIPVQVYAQPLADIDYTVDTASVTFSNNSVDATTHYWNFGDDTISDEVAPTHTYAETGTYLVTYVATNAICTDTITFEVTIDLLSGLTDLSMLGVKIFPNPTSNWVQLTGPAKFIGLHDLLGREILVEQDQVVDLRAQPAGLYLARIEVAGEQYVVRLQRR